MIDAFDAGEKPGAVMRFEVMALKGLPGKASIHQLGFADLMVALRHLTPAVARALPRLVDCVTRELLAWADADKLAEPCFANC